MATHFSVSDLTFEALPEEYQSIVVEVSQEAAKLGTENGKEFDKELLAELEEHNVTITDVDRDKFAEILEKLHDDLAEQLDATEVLELIRALQDE